MFAPPRGILVFVEKVALARLARSTGSLAIGLAVHFGAASARVRSPPRRFRPRGGALCLVRALNRCAFQLGLRANSGARGLTAPRCSRRSTTRRRGPAAWVLSVGPER